MIGIICFNIEATERFLEGLERKTDIRWMSGHKPTGWVGHERFRGFAIEDGQLGQVGHTPEAAFHYFKERSEADRDIKIFYIK